MTFESWSQLSKYKASATQAQAKAIVVELRHDFQRGMWQAAHSDPNWSILSNNKYNPGQPIQKPGLWWSSWPFWIRITFIWVHQGPPVLVLIFSFYYCYYIEFSNMESKPNFAKVHGPWWTQIKVVLIQKGLLDNQNPSFCMGWPRLYYLLDNIDQLGSLCIAWWEP